jgi:hypothetical protein
MTLLRKTAKLPLQVSNQLFDAARRVGIRRDLPGKLAVSQDLHFQFNAFVLRGHGGHSSVFYIRRGAALLFMRK